MKVIVYLVVLAALVYGGMYLYNNYMAQENVVVVETVAVPAAAPAVVNN